MTDLAERQADALAALDRALEARLGEIDRAFTTRRTDLEARLSEAAGRLTDYIESGSSEFKLVASDERRLLHEEAAARLAELDGAARQHWKVLEDLAASQLASLRELIDRVHDLERAAAARVRELSEQVGDSGGDSGWLSPTQGQP